eukprot:TRINITY_DN2839_c0_g1_i1.p1 TRINITY_DN2839_c0_g1~~TRINITY_DN2839_c0_g1_i1.p1  ORF type:complete len:324 (+),score=56.64 TRINITY_DN2839_c0_g1_i1:164-1135(+)
MYLPGSARLAEQISALTKVNDEIICRIKAKVESGDSKKTTSYVVSGTPGKDKTSFSISVQPVVQEVTYKEFVESWSVPEGATLPQDPDPSKKLTRDENQMSMKCVSFEDLVRINSQKKLALEYTLDLREELAVKFGCLFLKNFEILQVHLGQIETLLQENENVLPKINKKISEIHEKFLELFAISPNIFTTAPEQKDRNQQYAIGRTKGNYPGYRMLTNDELSSEKVFKEISLFQEKNGGLLGLETFTPKNALYTGTNFLKWQKGNYVAVKGVPGNAEVIQGGFVRIVEYPHQNESFPNFTLFEIEGRAYPAQAEYPSLFVKM